MEEARTFSQIMNGYFYQKGSLLQFVKDNYPFDNIKIKYRVLKRYLDGERVPSFPSAKALLNNMGLSYSEEELIELLENSTKEKEKRYRKEAIISNLTINYEDILKDYNYKNYEKVVILKGCLANMNSNTIKDYLIKLIDKDIKETIFNDSPKK